MNEKEILNEAMSKWWDWETRDDPKHKHTMTFKQYQNRHDIFYESNRKLAEIAFSEGMKQRADANMLYEMKVHTAKEIFKELDKLGKIGIESSEDETIVKTEAISMDYEDYKNLKKKWLR